MTVTPTALYEIIWDANREVKNLLTSLGLPWTDIEFSTWTSRHGGYRVLVQAWTPAGPARIKAVIKTLTPPEYRKYPEIAQWREEPLDFDENPGLHWTYGQDSFVVNVWPSTRDHR
jgi:hypothetical protein